MKNILSGIVCVALFSGVQAFADVVDFTGAYAPAKWSMSGAGAASTGIAQLTVTGSDDQSNTASTTELSITSLAPSFISFSWSYNSLDISPDLDPAGYVIGGAMFQLTDSLHFQLAQSGSVSSLFLAPGQSFGFYVYSTDNIGGSASLTISDFTAIAALPAPVPEPSTYAMIGLAAGAALLWKRHVSVSAK